MLREIFKQISVKDSPYKDIYYLTDTELRFTINKLEINKQFIVSIRHETDKYIGYIFDKNNINVSQIYKEIANINDFWQWFLNFYNSYK